MGLTKDMFLKFTDKTWSKDIENLKALPIIWLHSSTELLVQKFQKLQKILQIHIFASMNQEAKFQRKIQHSCYLCFALEVQSLKQYLYSIYKFSLYV